MNKITDNVALLDSVCQSFESEWASSKSDRNGKLERMLERRAGELSQCSDSERHQLLVRLIQLEIELRRRQGESPQAAEYAARFPSVEPQTVSDMLSMPFLPSFPTPEENLPNRYQLVDEIGQGGIGKVWRVTDTHMDRPLAVKLLLPKYRNNSNANARLQREATLTGSLQHPGVPPVHDHGTTLTGAQFFTMKIVDGQTLAEILEQREHDDVDLPHLLGIFEQVAQTLAYAHSQDVIHRDLKPQNIMVGEFGEVQVMDWGLATRITNRPADHRGQESRPPVHSPNKVEPTETLNQSIDSSLADIPAAGPDDSDQMLLTRPGDIFGTPAYMSPEQARGAIESLGPPSDVFGLGAILFEILTGHRLYDNIPREKVLAMAASGDLSSSLEQLKQCQADQSLVDLCRECLQANSEARPHDAGVVADRVTSYLEGVQNRLRQAEIEQAETAVKIAESRKRRRITRILVSAVLLALLAGVVGIAWQWRKTSDALVQSQKNFELATEQTKIANREREIATEQSELSLATLTDVVRNYQDVFDSTKYEKTLSEEGERARRKMLKTALEGLRQVSTRLKAHPDVSANLLIAHMDLGAVYLTIGGDNHEDARDLALAEYEEALSIGERFANSRPDDIYAWRLYAQCMENLGSLAMLNDDPDTAMDWLNQAIAIEQDLWERRPKSKAVPQDIFHIHYSAGTTEFRRFNLPAAADHFTKALAVVATASERGSDIVDEYEREYVLPELETRLKIITNLPDVRRNPDHALTFPDELAQRLYYDCSRWYLAENNHRQAFELLERIDSIESLTPNTQYNRACGYAQCVGAVNEADASSTDSDGNELREVYSQRTFDALNAAIDAGYFDDPRAIALVQRDPDMDSIRDDPRYEAFLERVQ